MKLAITVVVILTLLISFSLAGVGARPKYACYVDIADNFCYMCTARYEPYFGENTPFFDGYTNNRPNKGEIKWLECPFGCEHGLGGCVKDYGERKEKDITHSQPSHRYSWGCVDLSGTEIVDVAYCEEIKDEEMCPDTYTWIDCGQTCDRTTKQCGSPNDMFACIEREIDANLNFGYVVTSCFDRTQYMLNLGDPGTLCGTQEAKVEYCGNKRGDCSETEGLCRMRGVNNGVEDTDSIGGYIFACVEDGQVKFCADSKKMLQSLKTDPEKAQVKGQILETDLTPYYNIRVSATKDTGYMEATSVNSGQYELTLTLGTYKLSVIDSWEHTPFAETELIVDDLNTVYRVNFIIPRQDAQPVSEPHIVISTEEIKACNGEFVSCDMYCNEEKNICGDPMFLGCVTYGGAYSTLKVIDCINIDRKQLPEYEMGVGSSLCSGDRLSLQNCGEICDEQQDRCDGMGDVPSCWGEESYKGKNSVKCIFSARGLDDGVCNQECGETKDKKSFCYDPQCDGDFFCRSDEECKSEGSKTDSYCIDGSCYSCDEIDDFVTGDEKKEIIGDMKQLIKKIGDINEVENILDLLTRTLDLPEDPYENEYYAKLYDKDFEFDMLKKWKNKCFFPCDQNPEKCCNNQICEGDEDYDGDMCEYVEAFCDKKCDCDQECELDVSGNNKYCFMGFCHSCKEMYNTVYGTDTIDKTKILEDLSKIIKGMEDIGDIEELLERVEKEPYLPYDKSHIQDQLLSTDIEFDLWKAWKKSDCKTPCEQDPNTYCANLICEGGKNPKDEPECDYYGPFCDSSCYCDEECKDGKFCTVGFCNSCAELLDILHGKSEYIRDKSREDDLYWDKVFIKTWLSKCFYKKSAHTLMDILLYQILNLRNVNYPLSKPS